MKICITSTGKELSSKVDPRFGRCSVFMIVDPDTMEFEAFDNANISASGGAGVQSGQLMSEQKVAAVLTGNVGPNAFTTLNAAGIKSLTDVSGTIEEAVTAYKGGKLSITNKATVDSHNGSH